MTKVCSWALEEALQQTSDLGIVQLIHDGVLLVTDGQTDLDQLSHEVNQKLRDYAESTIGIRVSVSTTRCENESWIARAMAKGPNVDGSDDESTPDDAYH